MVILVVEEIAAIGLQGLFWPCWLLPTLPSTELSEGFPPPLPPGGPALVAGLRGRIHLREVRCPRFRPQTVRLRSLRIAGLTSAVVLPIGSQRPSSHMLSSTPLGIITPRALAGLVSKGLMLADLE